MSGIFETLVEQNTKIISLLEVIAGAYGKQSYKGVVAQDLTAIDISGNQQSFADAADAADAADEVAEEVAATVAEEAVVIGQETDASTLDKKGLPWDSRIHSTAKSFNADGTWKYLRGIDREVLVPQVEAELRAAMDVENYSNEIVAEAEEVAPIVTNVPVNDSPATAAAPVVAAPPVVAQPGLPPIGGVGLPPQAPVAINFPELEGEEGATDAAMEQTAAALAHKHGADALEKLYGLFGVGGGKTAKDIAAGYKFTFWQYATNDDFLRSQSVI